MKNHCRIFGIMASEAPVCILFRRGPTKLTQLVKWNTDTDTFEMGAWFKGRIYEHRSDVSPNGKYLIYFASKINSHTLKNPEGYTYAWTAISEPPRYTALMLWPKGDCWHGGGLFKSNEEVFLNHSPQSAKPHPKHISSLFKITPNPEAAGEDEPIDCMRLDRDGWKCIRDGIFPIDKSGWKTEQTEIWAKTGRAGKRLRRELLKIDFNVLGGPYINQYTLILKNGCEIKLKNVTWAELDQKDKLVFSRFGKIYRAKALKDSIEEIELMDLNSNTPTVKS